MKYQATVLCMGVFAAIAVTAHSSSAVGERWIVHSGNICQAFSQGSTSNPTLLERGIYGVDLGLGSASGTVWCPLPNVRDYAFPNDPWNISMSVYDRSDMADFNCTLFRQDTNSGNIVWSQTKSSSGAGSFQQYLGWWPPVVSQRYHYAITCDMPGFGTVGFSHLNSITMVYPGY
jgi:hypothetical protein